MKPKVAIFLEGYGFGGIPRVYSELAPLMKKSVNLEIIVFDGSGVPLEGFAEQLHNLKIIWPEGGFRFYYPIKVIKSLYRYIQIVKQNKYDIIISAGYLANTLCALFAKKYGYKPILSQHADYFLELRDKRSSVTFYIWNSILKYSFLKAEKIIGISAGVCNGLKDYLGIDAKRLTVIHNPVSIDIIKDKCQESLEVIEDEWFRKDLFHFISAGRFVTAKNFISLLDAFAAVVKKIPECRLTILGDGELRSVMERKADELKISAKVLMPGFKKNVFKYYKRANCFVSSSLWEGFGNVIVESMACGLPVISTMTSGCLDILSDETGKKYGMLIPVDDGEALANAMLKLASDVSLAKEYSDISLERAKVFDTGFISEKYINLINEVLISLV